MAYNFDDMAARFTARVAEAANWKQNYVGAAYATRIKAAIANLKHAIAEAERHPEIGKDNKWDSRFLELAKHVATWSKDPSTQTGAVIVRPDRTIASVGFNGFARGCDDGPELYADRPTKYARIIHCEMNAILSAREPLHGFTLYVFPFLTCDRCAVHVIQASIAKVVAPLCPPHLLERWGDTFERARRCYAEAGVSVSEELAR